PFILWKSLSPILLRLLSICVFEIKLKKFYKFPVYFIN
ncbi:hypothetical protein TNCT_517901, partial [Trichonephila clavata]